MIVFELEDLPSLFVSSTIPLALFYSYGNLVVLSELGFCKGKSGVLTSFEGGNDGVGIILSFFSSSD